MSSVRAMVDALTATFPDVGGAVTDGAEARRLLAARPTAPTPTIPVGRVDDRTLLLGDHDVPVRVYAPPSSGGTPGVVVYFHGGGWVLCDLDTHDGVCRRLARDARAVVVSVGYRLAPEQRFPAAVDDAVAALRWTAAMAESLGADPSRLAVAGDSAGGNLAAVAAQVARDEGGPAIAFQLLVYPITDHRFDTPSYVENGTGWFLTERHMRWYWDQYLGPDGDGADPRASPLRGDVRGLPPAFVLTAEHDPLRDEGEAYAAALAAAGVPVTVHRADGLFHGFFGLDAVVPEAAEPTALAVEALHKALA